MMPRCSTCDARADERIVYRPRLGRVLVERFACLGCVQPDLVTLRASGCEVIGITDAA